MTIEFPNLSRGYDATRRCVRFSGYDGALERPFFVEEEAIRSLDAAAKRSFLAHLIVTGTAFARRRRVPMAGGGSAPTR
jgi:Protein of unknown function (DUF1488)